MTAAPALPRASTSDEETRGGLATARAVALWLAIIVAFRVIAFQPFTIPSSSMEPGLVTGDYIIVSKFSYGWSRSSLPFGPQVGHGRLFGRSPARGDVVVFRATDDPGNVLVKRVVGLPGDRVQMRNGSVLLNGRPLATSPLGEANDRDAPGVRVAVAEERTPAGRAYRTFDRGPGAEGDDTGVFRVPDGSYFMLGDNRDNSLDSRWPAGFGVGPIPAENLIGEAELVLMSWRPGASLFKPWTWLSLSADRFLLPVR
ncbi:MAG TPA: signal peptidase I [Caulobacteraceae bacterium]|jgi:signal peptidase I